MQLKQLNIKVDNNLFMKSNQNQIFIILAILLRNVLEVDGATSGLTSSVIEPNPYRADSDVCNLYGKT